MLKIVETTAGESGRAQRTVLITVEGDTPDEANSVEAKKLAYGERARLGLSEAGIEYVGGAFPVEAVGEKPVPGPTSDNPVVPDRKYRRTFRLTQAL
jgi:hypothetical protein